MGWFLLVISCLAQDGGPRLLELEEWFGAHPTFAEILPPGWRVGLRLRCLVALLPKLHSRNLSAGLGRVVSSAGGPTDWCREVVL